MMFHRKLMQGCCSPGDPQMRHFSPSAINSDSGRWGGMWLVDAALSVLEIKAFFLHLTCLPIVWLLIGKTEVWRPTPVWERLSWQYIFSVASAACDFCSYANQRLFVVLWRGCNQDVFTREQEIRGKNKENDGWLFKSWNNLGNVY